MIRQFAGMKFCAYCGKENDDSSAHCCECGMEEFTATARAAMTPTLAQPFSPNPSPRWRYGLLCILLLLAVWILSGLPETLHSQKPGRFGNLLMVMALLFKHVAFYFIRPPLLRRVAIVIALAWMLFTISYCFTAGFTRTLLRWPGRGQNGNRNVGIAHWQDYA
jgi:hypothetical protein